MKTKVKFLIEKEYNPDFEPQVFAFFPEEKFTHWNDTTFMSYAHIGQHSPCHIDYANECKEATEDQYKDLKRELELIGYELEILNTQTVNQ